ncbi:hypothetical protein LCGC14_0598160 [marine sediment metagenome]|uniref:Uncharacterized protein n=1 Tax=marine sediment metagenome TaxID=412755 RepID=A0A0F9RV68_9ZZZZ
MGIIETKIKNAFGQYRKDGDLLRFTKDIAHVGDYSVNSQTQAAIMYDAIREHCPKPVFECIYYDGEHGEYHLFDFDPNLISRKSLLIEVRSRLQHEIGIELDYIDKAMESVYLLNVNTLVRITK